MARGVRLGIGLGMSALACLFSSFPGAAQPAAGTGSQSAGSPSAPLPVAGTQPSKAAASRRQNSVADQVAAPSVRFEEWMKQLLALIDETPAPSVDQEFPKFAAQHGLSPEDPGLKRDFRRVRLLFETTRDGGFWHLRWAITDQYPSSRNIWQQLAKNPVDSAFAAVAATAECDELSALLGMLAKHADVKNVGLFYPTWNHTIAVWAPLAGKTQTPVIQLPTSQIFLNCEAGFDKTTFATRRKNIQPYPAHDLKKDTLLPAARAGWLLDQVRTYAAASAELWSLIRAKRALLMDSSMGSCNATRAAWRKQLAARITPADERALRSLGSQELALPHATPQMVLDWLAQAEPVQEGPSER